MVRSLVNFYLIIQINGSRNDWPVPQLKRVSTKPLIDLQIGRKEKEEATRSIQKANPANQVWLPKTNLLQQVLQKECLQ